MLTISHGAADVIRRLARTEELPDEGGVRIELRGADQPTNGNQPGDVLLALSVVPEGQPGDQDVPVPGGGHVFVEADTVLLLEDKTLDGRVGDDGRVAFTLTQG